MACLEMLARHHNVPFRRDVIERAAKDNLRGQRSTSLELIGNLSTLMGFTGTLAELPEAQVVRASFPCIAVLCGQPSLIHEIRRGEVFAVIPEYGSVRASIIRASAIKAVQGFCCSIQVGMHNDANWAFPGFIPDTKVSPQFD